MCQVNTTAELLPCFDIRKLYKENKVSHQELHIQARGRLDEDSMNAVRLPTWPADQVTAGALDLTESPCGQRSRSEHSCRQRQVETRFDLTLHVVGPWRPEADVKSQAGATWKMECEARMWRPSIRKESNGARKWRKGEGEAWEYGKKVERRKSDE